MLELSVVQTSVAVRIEHLEREFELTLGNYRHSDS